MQRPGPDEDERHHVLEAAGPGRGRGGHTLLLAQVCLRGSLQHRHPPTHQYTEDYAGESNQGRLLEPLV